MHKAHSTLAPAALRTACQPLDSSDSIMLYGKLAALTQAFKTLEDMSYKVPARVILQQAQQELEFLKGEGVGGGEILRVACNAGTEVPGKNGNVKVTQEEITFLSSLSERCENLQKTIGAQDRGRK